MMADIERRHHPEMPRSGLEGGFRLPKSQDHPSRLR
jgi:hypothetical protein